MATELRDMQIVLVDDNRTNLDLLEQILGTAGYENVVSISDATLLADRLQENPPDLVLLDLHMPQVDGFEVLRSLQPALGAPHYLPVLVVSADTSIDIRRRALQLGARDFVLKPVDAIEVLLRTHNLLEARYLSRTLPRELEEARLHSLDRLARFAEMRKAADFGHPLRVAERSGQLAAALGLPVNAADQIRLAATFHDIGKLAVTERALHGSLDDEDLAELRLHTLIGADVLAAGSSTAIDLAAAIARSHHECWDGSGYPDGLEGEAIPIAARIVAVADAYDHLVAGGTADAQARNQLAEQGGSRFDPAVVDALRTLPAPSAGWAAAA
jgi:putative two-component system response regulator